MDILKELNELLVFDVWEKQKYIDEKRKELLSMLATKNYKTLYRRQKRKEIIHVGLQDPSLNIPGAQTLMFGPAGNLPSSPEIIITGISTSISAANELARLLKRNYNSNFNNLDLAFAYMSIIYKGRMYNVFKKTWLDATKDSYYKSLFDNLFLMIEGKKPIEKDYPIMLTQLTLHGVATYQRSWRDNTLKWSSPSTEVFNSNAADNLYQEFFVEKVLKERFLSSKNSRFMFIMGNDAYSKVTTTLKKGGLFNSNIIIQKLDEGFNLRDLEKDKDRKYIYGIRHSASK